MKKNFIIFVAIIFVSFFGISQLSVTTSSAITAPLGAGTTGISTPLGGGSQELPNPLGTSDPRDLIGVIIRTVLGLAGSLALAVVVWGGITWILSAGNEKKVAEGKEMIIWASLGIILIFASYSIIQFVLGTFFG